MIVASTITNPGCRRAVANIGHDIWTMALEQFGDHGVFEVDELIPLVRERWAFSRSTAHQYINATMVSMEAEGHGQAERVRSRGVWRVSSAGHAS